MDEQTPTNGSAGRFLRIEEKLDVLVEQVTEVRVKVGMLEGMSNAVKDNTSRVDRLENLKWVMRGVVVSIAMGAIALIDLAYRIANNR